MRCVCVCEGGGGGGGGEFCVCAWGLEKSVWYGYRTNGLINEPGWLALQRSLSLG